MGKKFFDEFLEPKDQKKQFSLGNFFERKIQKNFLGQARLRKENYFWAIFSSEKDKKLFFEQFPSKFEENNFFLGNYVERKGQKIFSE